MHGRQGSTRRSLATSTSLVSPPPPSTPAGLEDRRTRLTALPRRPAADDEGRPIHLLKASLPLIKEFVAKKLPQEPAAVDGEGDVLMGGS